MNFSKINELKPYNLNCNIFDVYSYDGLSMQELLCQFFTKINECIKTSNETIDLAEWLVNEGLKQEVALKLTTWLNDGTLENLINVTLFENLNKKIDNVSSQLKQIAHSSNEFNFSSSKLSTNGSILAGSNILTVDYIGDFKIGQGIAIYNATRLRNTDDTWLCSEIVSINGNEITLKDYATHSITNTKVEHDNYFSFKKMENYFKDLNYVNIKFDQGEYLLHCVHQTEVEGRLEKNNIDSIVLELKNKNSINIDFRGAIFKSIGDYKIQKDYMLLDTYTRNAVKNPTFISLKNCNNVKIKNFEYNANSISNILSKGITAESWSYGLEVLGGHNIEITNIDIREVESDGFYLGHDNYNPLYNVKMLNCKSTHCGRQGLTIGGGAYIDIEKCEFNYTGRDLNMNRLKYISSPSAGIDLELETGFNIPEELNQYSSIRNIKIKNCKLINNNYTLANGSYAGNLIVEDTYFKFDNSNQSDYLFVISKAEENLIFKNCKFEVLNGKMSSYIRIQAKNTLFDNCEFLGIAYITNNNNECDKIKIQNSKIVFNWNDKLEIYWLYNYNSRIHKIENCDIIYTKEYIKNECVGGINGNIINSRIIYEDLDEGFTNKRSLFNFSANNVDVYDNKQNSLLIYNKNNYSILDKESHINISNTQVNTKKINIDDYEMTKPEHIVVNNDYTSITIKNETNYVFSDRVYNTLNIKIDVDKYFGSRSVYLTGLYTSSSGFVTVNILENSIYTFENGIKTIKFTPTSKNMRIDFLETPNKVIKVVVNDFNYVSIVTE